MAHEIQNDEFGRVATNADTFRYDARGQVTDAAIATNVFTHAYDGIGNHLLAGANATTNAIVNNALNQTTAFGGETIAWNTDGDMASDADWNYDYDAEDRLVATTSRTLTNGALRVRNDYDYRNRRVMKAVDRYDAGSGEWNLAERRDFVWDDWNIVHETVSVINGGTTNVSEIQYFWGPDLSGTLQGAGGVGGLLAVSRDGLFYFPVYDNNGNVMKYVDESGSIVADYLYDDFGRTISQVGELADSFTFGFSTKYLDRETDLVAYQRRFYDFARKNWLSRDPIEENGGINLYSICRNNLLFAFDRFGLAIIVIKHLPGTEPPDGWGSEQQLALTVFKSPRASVEHLKYSNGKMRFKITLNPPNSFVHIYFQYLSTMELAMLHERDHVEVARCTEEAFYEFKRAAESIYECSDVARERLDKEEEKLRDRLKELDKLNRSYDEDSSKRKGPHVLQDNIYELLERLGER